jgi:hypothetical protein
VLLLAAGVSLIVPAMVRWVRGGSVSATPIASKIVITARLPPAIERCNHVVLGETQTPR